MQGFIDQVGNTTMYLTTLAFVVITWWVIASTVRRLLGVSVGWIRAILVSIVMVSSVGGVVPWMAEATGFEPDYFDVTMGGPFAMVLLMTALWSFAIGALILVALEIIIPTGSLPSYRELFFGWGKRFRRARAGT